MSLLWSNYVDCNQFRLTVHLYMLLLHKCLFLSLLLLLVMFFLYLHGKALSQCAVTILAFKGLFIFLVYTFFKLQFTSFNAEQPLQGT